MFSEMFKLKKNINSQKEKVFVKIEYLFLSQADPD